MDQWQSIASLMIFVGVIGAITLEWVHLTIAAMLGALMLVMLNILTLEQAIGYIANSHTTLGLFLGVMVMVPFLFKKIWRTQLSNLDHLPLPTIQYPKVLILESIIFLLVLVFFVVGEMLPVPVSPATIALLGAVLCLLVTHCSRIDSVSNILRDVDWSTILFFMSIFVVIGALQKTGVISSASGFLEIILGKNIALGSIVLLFTIGLISSVVPNIPLVIAMVPLLKEYIVNAGFVGAEILAPNSTTPIPTAVLPLFYAMMYGAAGGQRDARGSLCQYCCGGDCGAVWKSKIFTAIVYDTKMLRSLLFFGAKKR